METTKTPSVELEIATLTARLEAKIKRLENENASLRGELQIHMAHLRSVGETPFSQAVPWCQRLLDDLVITENGTIGIGEETQEHIKSCPFCQRIQDALEEAAKHKVVSCADSVIEHIKADRRET